MSNIKKIWGYRHRILKTKETEVDLLFLDAKSECSIHRHEAKINRFVLLSGRIQIKTDMGTKELVINEPFDVEPPSIHQFIILKDSVMIELAFVKSGEIDVNDIERFRQGGKTINNVFKTLDELRDEGCLILNS